MECDLPPPNIRRLFDRLIPLLQSAHISTERERRDVSTLLAWVETQHECELTPEFSESD